MAIQANSAEMHLAALFPKNMGNRGPNMLSVREIFRKLVAGASRRVKFVAYHPRISGNFVFRYSDENALREAVKIGEQEICLPCIARSFQELTRADADVPREAKEIRNSVVLPTPAGIRRVILVALSEQILAKYRETGRVGKRIEILSWPSDQDVLCLYDRPGESGDVGQVTRAVEGKLRQVGGHSNLYGTGRGMGVVRDLLAGRCLRKD